MCRGSREAFAAGKVGDDVRDAGDREPKGGARVKALVIGGAGFIGRHLIPLLREAEYEILAVDPSFTHTRILPKSVHIEFAGKFERWSISDWCPTNEFDVVIHLGANIAPIDERSKGGIQHYQDLALDLTVAQWVAKHPPKKCFIYPSSCAVDAPDDPYGWVKATGEKLCHALAKEGVLVVILRPFSGYGHDQADTYPFPAILKRVLRGDDPVVVWGSGNQVRDWIHIDDLARAFIWAIDRAPHAVPIEIGRGIGCRLALLAETMIEAAGSFSKLVFDSAKPESTYKRVANVELARLNGFYPEISLKEGIRRSIAALQPKLNKIGVAGVSLNR